MNANEPLLKYRENEPSVKTVGILLLKEGVQRLPVSGCAAGVIKEA